MLPLLVPAGCTRASSGDPDDASVGWVALSGELTRRTDADGATLLHWQFEYGKEPSVITCAASGPWKAMRSIRFDIRSDRGGPLFLRLDQTDRKIFLTHFDVTESWRHMELTAADFQPFGSTTGRVNATNIDRVFIVDLNGSDGGARGWRSIFLRGLTVGGLKTEPRTKVEMDVSLVAFDSSGRVLDVRRFAERGTSAGRWCFVTDENGSAVPTTVDERSVTVDGKSASVPVLSIGATVQATLEVLFWPVGSAFNVWLQVDGRGKGIAAAAKDGIVVLNTELAWTRLRKLRAYLARDGANSHQAEVESLAGELERAEKLSSHAAQAAAADRVLERLLMLSRDAVRERSRRLIEARLRPGAPVVVPSPGSETLTEGQSVTIELIEPEFRIGLGQSFGFVLGRTPPDEVHRYYAELRQAGFNHYVLPLFWDQLVDSSGKYDATRWHQSLGFTKLVELDFTLQAHSIIQSSLPQKVKDLKGQALTHAAKEQLSRVADDFDRRMGPSILLWEAVNEPSSNAFGGFDPQQRVQMVSDLIGRLRSTVPGARVMVNDFDWERGIEANRPWEQRTVVATIEFYKRLVAADPKPDVLGLEWYPGLRVDQPMFKLDVAEPCRDLLDTSLYWDRLIALGLPVMISECNFPGRTKPGDKNGYAWGRWDDNAQAAAAVDTLSLALSKPEIVGWVWWSITDDEPWNRAGGLYTAPHERKPVMDRLEAVISSLKSPIRATVAVGGKLPLPALPGTYRIVGPSGSAWRVDRNAAGQVTTPDHE